jgi:hypothetical protein
MARKVLTDRTLKSLKPAASHYDVWDATVPGLGVRVSQTGQHLACHCCPFGNILATKLALLSVARCNAKIRSKRHGASITETHVTLCAGITPQ